MKITLDAVLLEREPGHWVGQYLQYDIGAQADSLPDLLYQMQRSLMGYTLICAHNGVEPFCGMPAAPQEYWDLWRHSHIEVEAADMANFRLPHPVTFLPENGALRVAST